MLHYQPQPEKASDARLGLVIGKKYVRSAVKRNLIKRIMRERFRLCHARLQGYDLVFRMVTKPERYDRRQIADEIESLFAKLRPRGRVAAMDGGSH